MSKFDWSEGDLIIQQPTKSAREHKRDEVVKARAAACARVCVALLAIPDNDNDIDDSVLRKTLMSLTRLATLPKWRERVSLRSAGALDVDWDDARAAGDPLHVEHVVPIRVLVERMLVCRDEPSEVFASSLLAICRKSEHERIGPLLKAHRPVYKKMIDPSTPLAALSDLGRQRYERASIDLHDVP